jgi:citrate lyase beta subunit
MLEKSFASPADSVCYDLEDSVAPGKKAEARGAVVELLNVGGFSTTRAVRADLIPYKAALLCGADSGGADRVRMC